ncbi:MAG: rod shape-determining protein MreC [Clostridia bacterium]|nr:rod shape-determining protein MreC [Clostridia bacterium]
MRWIRDHKLISILIVVILVTTVLLIFAVDSKGVGNRSTSLVNSVVTTIEKPFIAIGEGISERAENIFNAGTLREENEKLKEENALLKAKLRANSIKQSDLRELKNLAKALNYSFVNTKNIATGDIISYDGTNWTNIFTINIGTNDGVAVNDTVVYGDMLVGRVSDVGKNWAKVTSLIDESCDASFRVVRNEKLVGVLTSAEKGELKGFMLDGKTSIIVGDKIVTTGMGLYPRGLEIGTISKVSFDSDSKLTEVNVRPSVTFSSLQKVSVIR